ncbi:MAG: phage holin family protein [Minisyncoccia bacterium]
MSSLYQQLDLKKRPTTGIINQLDNMRFLLRLLFTLLGLWLATKLLTGFVVVGGWESYLIVAVVLVVLNLLLRPILKLISFPIILLTLGLFSIVINAIILWLTSQITGMLLINNLLTLLWATLIISVLNMFANWKK